MSKEITRAELARLSFCNSDRLQGLVNIKGRAMEWVGIGWIDTGPATGREKLTVVEKKTTKKKRKKAKK